MSSGRTTLVAAMICLIVGPSLAAAQPAPSRLGVAITAGTLGAGIDVATPVLPTANLRVGFHTFTYDHSFTGDVPIAAELKLESFDAH